MKNLNYLLLSFILLLAIILRVIAINQSSPALNWDEAALGYNAYSIIHTSKDEYGNFLPLNLKSFGDYKPAVYAYLDVPFVAILGLNTLAVRLPAILFGVLAVLFLYLLTNELFKNPNLSLLTALMLAISPLSIGFSRPAFEAGVAFSLDLLGTLLVIKSFKNPKLLVLSALIFGISLFTYQGSKLFLVTLLPLLYLFFRKEFKNRQTIFLSAVIFFIFLSVAGLLTVFLGQANRLQAVNLFAYPRIDQQINQLVTDTGWTKTDPRFQIFYGEWFAYIKGLIERFSIYFSPKMLFVDGDYNIRHRVPDLGVFYYFSIFLVPAGIYFLIQKNLKIFQLLFAWFVISIIPAVLSRDLISTLRALNILLPVSILEGAGIYYLWELVKLKIPRLLPLFGVILATIILFNFLIFADRYFIHLPKEYSKDWLYGYQQSIEKLANLMSFKKYDRVIFTDYYGQPYIYYLFYTKYDPVKYQLQAQLEQPSVDVGTVRKIDNINFRHIYLPADRGSKNTLLIGTPEELPDKDISDNKVFNIIDRINFLDNTPAFIIVEVKQ
ncbi:MAG: glycosyltransferase family 39 protein [Candidatus Daviesbacteria bacterium]|nr:glycosyltransferase family 39 protein [Candidatus Daviesbacteria bacterium]